MTISLDHHATTPTASEVVEAMSPFWRDMPWNAHSPHAGGALAEQAVEHARAAVARLVGATPAEITFTSGATEANNIALLGTAAAARRKSPERTRILTSTIEHKCVLDAARHLNETGFQHGLIPVDRSGIIDLGSIDRLLGTDVLLVAVMAANNEVGTIQPIEEIARKCSDAGALLHVDAAQAVGRIPVDFDMLGCDLASLSAHKMYGPKGIGALFVSANAPFRPSPIMYGGGQEQGLRPGTLPVPLIVGFGRAAELAATRLDRAASLNELSETFLSELVHQGLDPLVNGDRSHRLPGSLNLRVSGVDAEDVVLRLGRRLHLSTGSACQSGELQGSYVLSAMGLTSSEVRSSFRVCFGSDHSREDAVTAARLLAETIRL